MTRRMTGTHLSSCSGVMIDAPGASILTAEQEDKWVPVILRVIGKGPGR